VPAQSPPVAFTPPPQPEPYHQPAPAAPEPYRPPAPAAPGAGPQAGKGPTIIVELGTRSASNFYKGLAGNDVVEHGGVFVATYKIPKIGSTVQLHVLLPGNYEFYASALVQWVREPRSDTTEPGFGARFVDITPDGRQLVYRYARNREPLFYDDL
jgi:Tfp pilus assembly protein PilZ